VERSARRGVVGVAKAVEASILELVQPVNIATCSSIGVLHVRKEKDSKLAQGAPGLLEGARMSARRAQGLVGRCPGWRVWVTQQKGLLVRLNERISSQ